MTGYRAPVRLAAFIVALVSALTAHAGEVVLSYRVETRVRTRAVDADLWAGGSFLMRSTSEADGLRLSMVKPIDDPWKFHWVNPLIGRSEVKFGTVATLAAPTSRARLESDRRTNERAKTTHAEWQSRWDGEADLDGWYSFYVLGDIADRFRVGVAPGGRVYNIENLVTNRWVPNGLALWLSGQPVEGYSHWADDPEPPEWRSHSYEAFVAAIELLARPVLPSDDPTSIVDLRPGASFEHEHRRLLPTAARVIETLAPAAKGRFDAKSTVPVTYTVTDAGPGLIGLDGVSTVSLPEGRLRVHRTAVLEMQGAGAVSDSLEIELIRGGELTFVVQVSYAPTAPMATTQPTAPATRKRRR